MIKTIESAKALAKKFNAIEDDKDRLAFLKKNNGDLKVILDNDQSSVAFIMPEDIDPDLEGLINDIDLNDFNEYHGWGDGVILLMEFAGITAEAC